MRLSHRRINHGRIITKSRSKQYISEILHSELSDEQLHDIMNVLLEPMVYNCRIVPDDAEENNDYFLDYKMFY